MKTDFKIHLTAMYTISVYVVVAFCLLGSYPYVFSQFLTIPPMAIVMAIGILSLMIIILFFKRKFKPFPKLFNQIVILQICIWLIFTVIHRDLTYVTRIVYIGLSYLSLLCLHNTSGKILNFFKINNVWICVMCVSGAIAFFLVLLGFLKPLFEFQNLDGRNAYCFGLTCTNIYLGNIIRFSGYLDEPGAIANWGIWALILNKTLIKNRLLEYLLITSLIFTFSLAFYIQILVYYILFNVKGFKQVSKLAIAAILIIGLIIYSKDTEFDVYKYTLYRVESSGSGNINGDNRSNLADIAKQAFFESPIFGVGAYNASINYEYMGDNPYTLLAYDGIVGTVNTYIPFIILFFLCGDKNIRKGLIIIMIGYLQRPFSVFLISPFMQYGYFLVFYTYYENIKHFSRTRLFNIQNI